MTPNEIRPGEPKPPTFTPTLDARILGGLIADEDELLEETKAMGHSEATVRARTSKLGLTDQVVATCRLISASPAMRRCLACDRRSLSVGPQFRLFKRCRRPS